MMRRSSRLTSTGETPAKPIDAITPPPSGCRGSSDGMAGCFRALARVAAPPSRCRQDSPLAGAPGNSRERVRVWAEPTTKRAARAPRRLRRGFGAPRHPPRSADCRSPPPGALQHHCWLKPTKECRAREPSRDGTATAYRGDAAFRRRPAGCTSRSSAGPT